MTTAIASQDLVGTALLGTDRRPSTGVPDPARGLLDEAVRSRARRQLAVGLDTCPPAEHGPPQVLALPPRAARTLLDEILTRPGALVVDLWLGEATAYGCGLAPQHWTAVLDLAARQPTIDRRRVVAALGERGLWFARHNAAWRRVVQAGSMPADEALPPRGLGVVDAETPASGPDQVFALPDPWSDPVCRAVVDVLAAGSMPWRAATTYGTAVGARLPLTAYGMLGQAIDRQASARPARTAPSTARAGLTAADDVVWMRLVLRRAFDASHALPDRHLTPEARP